MSKYLLIIEDTVTIAGPGIDVKIVTEPPITSMEEMQACNSTAVAIGQAALQTVHNILQIGAKMAGPGSPPEIQLDAPRNAPE